MTKHATISLTVKWNCPYCNQVFNVELNEENIDVIDKKHYCAETNEGYSLKTEDE